MDTDAIDAEITAAEIAAAEAELRAARIDGSRMLLERDAETGAREILHFDEGEGTFSIERVADVEPVLEWCKGRYNEGIANRHCEFRPLASLPTVVLDIRGKARGLPDGWYLKKEYQREVLNAAHDPDLSGFRTMSGEFRRRGEG
jgi:hypothetical protein